MQAEETSENETVVETESPTLKTLDADLRPRERLLQYGAAALTDYELLAILLRSGRHGENVVQLAMRVLERFGSLYGLKHASYYDLTAIAGIGPAKAVTLLAAVALGTRIAAARRQKGQAFTSSERAGQYFTEQLHDLEQEHVVVAFLNTKNELLAEKTVFVGSLNSAVAHPREIFKEAVRVAAAHLFIAHNHPSGNPEPSKQDIELTLRLVSCGKLMGIDVLDHFIVGDDTYVSLRERGVF